MSSLKGTMINCITTVPLTVCSDAKLELCENFLVLRYKFRIICEDFFDSRVLNPDTTEFYGNAL